MESRKNDVAKGLAIEEVWPVRMDLHPNGGIGIYWHGEIGWGEYVLFWDDDGKLHADTECLLNMLQKIVVPKCWK